MDASTFIRMIPPRGVIGNGGSGAMLDYRFIELKTEACKRRVKEEFLRHPQIGLGLFGEPVLAVEI